MNGSSKSYVMHGAVLLSALGIGGMGSANAGPMMMERAIAAPAAQHEMIPSLPNVARELSGEIGRENDAIVQFASAICDTCHRVMKAETPESAKKAHEEMWRDLKGSNASSAQDLERSAAINQQDPFERVRTPAN